MMYNYTNPYAANPNQAYANYQQQLANLQAQYPGYNFNFNQPQQMPPAQPQQQAAPQAMFLQPNGSLFSIDNVDQLSNVPVQEGTISGVIFPSANMMYLKSMQNGKPVILTYSLTNTEAVKAKEEEIIVKPKEDNFKVETNQNLSILGETATKLWTEVETLKEKLAKIYEQLGVDDSGK